MIKSTKSSLSYISRSSDVVSSLLLRNANLTANKKKLLSIFLLFPFHFGSSPAGWANEPADWTCSLAGRYQ